MESRLALSCGLFFFLLLFMGVGCSSPVILPAEPECQKDSDCASKKCESGACQKKVIFSKDCVPSHYPKRLVNKTTGFRTRMVRYSPSGDYLAVSADRKVFVWSMKKKLLLHTFELKKQVNAIRFLGDLDLIVATDKITVWGVDTGRQMYTLSPKAEDVVVKQILSLAVHQDKKLLFSGGEDKKVHVWSLASKALSKTIKGFALSTRKLTLSSDGKTLFVVSSEPGPQAFRGSDLVALDWQSGKEKWRKNFVKRSLLGFAVDPKGKKLAVGLEAFGLVPDKRKVIEIDSSTGREVGSAVKFQSQITALGYAPKEEQLFVGVESGKSVLLKIDTTGTFRKVLEFWGPWKTFASLHFHPSKPIFVTAGYPNSLVFWDVKTGKSLPILQKDFPFVLPPIHIAFHPNGKTYALRGKYRDVQVRETGSNKFLRSFSTQSVGFDKNIDEFQEVKGLVFRPDGSHIALSTGPFVGLIGTESGKIKVIGIHGKPRLGYSNVSFSADSKYLATAKSQPDGRPANGAVIVDISSEKVVKDLEHSKDIRHIVYRRDGRVIAGFGAYEDLVIWDAKSGKKLQSFKIGESENLVIKNLKFSPDGRYLVVSFQREKIVLFKLDKSGQKYAIFKDDFSVGGTQVAFSQNSKLLAIGGKGSIWFWSIEKNQSLGKLPLLHEVINEGLNWVQDMAFQPNGHHFYALVNGGNVYSWQCQPD